MGLEERSSRVRPGLAEVLIVAGGVAAAVGSFFDWFTIRLRAARLGAFSKTLTSKGIDGPDGKVTLVAGMVVVIAGLLLWVWSSDGQRVFLGIVALLGGLVAGGLSGFDAVTAKDRFVSAYSADLVRSARISPGQATLALRRLVDLGILRVSVAGGVLLVIGGGAVAALAAAFSLGGSSREYELQPSSGPDAPSEQTA